MKNLVEGITADGVVDADEVKAFEAAVYADGVIDKEEADAAFEINDAVSGNENDAAWALLFVNIISDYVLKDEATPGVIDEKEGQYIVEQIGADGKVDDAEKALLLNLEVNATAIESEELLALIASVK